MLITAEQARQRAKTYISVYEQSQLEQIMENISKESGQGYLKYYGDEALRPIVKKKLEELGYEVTICNRYNEPEYCISWE